ncbi:MAG: hypothetical protein RL417_1923 [Pseudomonadota bacterium]
MGSKSSGSFSKNFLSLQLQLETLLEDVGGDRAVEVLDSLSQLSGSEQKLVLGVFDRVIKRIAAGSERLVSNDDRRMKEFEDSLYSDIVSAIESSSGEAPRGRLIEVLDGGKTPKQADRTPISLDDARKARKARSFFN